MDPIIWNALPTELAEHICNQLPKVRSMNPSMKREIESQRWMLAKSFNWYLRLNQFHAREAYRMFDKDLRLLFGLDGHVNEQWALLSPDDRIEFYYRPGGPGSPEGAQMAENELMFREWLNN